MLLHELDAVAESISDHSLEYIILRVLGKSSVEFMGKLKHFFVIRSENERVYQANSTPGELEALAVEACGIENAEGTFKPERRQQTVDGTPVTTLDELYAAAEVAMVRPANPTDLARPSRLRCLTCRATSL